MSWPLRTAAAVVSTAAAISPLAACSADPAAGQSGTSSAAAAAADPRWPAPTNDVASRVAAAGLDLGPMGMAEHYHPRLRLVLNGTEIQVAPNIGVDPTTGAMSALHTHEADGTIHIEADQPREVFTLGQLFTQWGVTLTSTRVGDVQATSGQQVRVTSNGAPVTEDPRDLRLQPDQQILVQLP